jgi:4-carboxymuconolactone decarboxylase
MSLEEHLAGLPLSGPSPMLAVGQARGQFSFRSNVMNDPAPDADRYELGLAVRRSVLGDSHVDRAELVSTDFDRPFQELITEAAWGHVWSRPNWTKRERSIVTLALLAALGHDDEVAMHVRASANTGATPEDIREAFLHVAIYAGVPAANRAIRIAKEVLAEMEANPEKPDER